MRPSDRTLDDVVQRLDSDADGTVSSEDFKSTFSSRRAPGARRRRFFWKALAAKVARKGRNEKRKLDAAFRLDDVEKIENLAFSPGDEEESSSAGDAERIRSTLAVHVKGESEPILVHCGKPGHAVAWMETFSTCLGSFKAHFPARFAPAEGDAARRGLLIGPDEAPKCKKRDRRSRKAFLKSPISWGDNDDTDEECKGGS